MTSLKNFLRNCISLREYLKRYSQKAGIMSVYNEQSRPKNAIRIWVSYDIDNDSDNHRHKLLYNWLSNYDAESWGNSVATFLWNIQQEPTNELVAKWLVDELINASVLNGNSFEDKEWMRTKNISLYIIYRYNEEGKMNSNHFVLIQNAEITHNGVY